MTPEEQEYIDDVDKRLQEELDRRRAVLAEVRELAYAAGFRAGAEAMRIKAVDGSAITMNGWGTTGSYRDFGVQLIDVLNAMPLPEMKP